MGAPGPDVIDNHFDQVINVDTLDFEARGYIDRRNIAHLESIRLVVHHVVVGGNLAPYLGDDPLADICDALGADNWEVV